MIHQKISIIIPIFNAEKYINGCLSSIISQTYVDWECICVDDESSDKSLEIIHRFSASDPRFRVVQQSNGGPGVARNTGLKEVKSEFFTFVDADDLVHRKMLEKLFYLERQYKADLVVCSYQRFYSDSEFDADGIVDGGSEGEPAVFEAPMLPMMRDWRRFRVHPHGKLYKLSVHCDLRFPGLRGPEDAYASIDVYARSKKAVFTSERLYGYREVPTGLTQSVAKYRNYIYGDTQVAIHCQEVFSEHGIADDVTEKVAMTYVMRIFHYANEMAVDSRLAIGERRNLMSLAFKGICDIRRHVAGRFQIVPPIHYLTFFAIRFKLLWLLELRHRVKRVLKAVFQDRIFNKPFRQEGAVR
jgi:glycosyltransferase involved in cell wall biosynthesis